MKLTEYTALPTGGFTMTFAADAETFDKALDAAWAERGDHYSIPGYEKGKAPRSAIEQRYGKNVFWYDAFDAVMQDEFDAAFAAACTEKGIVPSCEPLPAVGEVDAETGFTVTATSMVLPPIDRALYIGQPLSILYPAVTDEMVDTELRHMREARPYLKDVDAPADADKTVVLTFKGYHDGKKVAPACAADFKMPMANQTFLPGFSEALSGHKAGDALKIAVDFPHDHKIKDLAGLHVDFDVTLDRVCERCIPAADDAFAREYGKCDTWAQLRAQTRARLEKDARHRAERRAEGQLHAAIAESYGVVVPEAFADEQFQHDMHHFEMALAMQHLKWADFERMSRKSRAEIEAGVRRDAATEAKVNFLLLAVAAAEGLRPSEKDVDSRYADYLNKQEKLPEEVREQYTRETFIENMKKDLAVRFLRDNAKTSFTQL